jgi:hypothetical protein
MLLRTGVRRLLENRQRMLRTSIVKSCSRPNGGGDSDPTSHLFQCRRPSKYHDVPFPRQIESVVPTSKTIYKVLVESVHGQSALEALAACIVNFDSSYYSL